MKTLFGTYFEVAVYCTEEPSRGKVVKQNIIARKKEETTTTYWERCCNLFMEGLGDDITLKIDIANMIYLWYCSFRSKNEKDIDKLTELYNRFMESEEFIELKKDAFKNLVNILLPALGNVNDIVDILKNHKEK